jgi:hypothetical protein
MLATKANSDSDFLENSPRFQKHSDGFTGLLRSPCTQKNKSYFINLTLKRENCASGFSVRSNSKTTLASVARFS